MSMAEFFRMGGYAGYVWSCYGLTLAVLLGNLWFARRELTEQVVRATRRTQVSIAPGSIAPGSTTSGSATAENVS
jgi:heme exporter protein D